MTRWSRQRMILCRVINMTIPLPTHLGPWQIEEQLLQLQSSSTITQVPSSSTTILSFFMSRPLENQAPNLHLAIAEIHCRTKCGADSILLLGADIFNIDGEYTGSLLELSALEFFLSLCSGSGSVPFRNNSTIHPRHALSRLWNEILRKQDFASARQIIHRSGLERLVATGVIVASGEIIIFRLHLKVVVGGLSSMSLRYTPGGGESLVGKSSKKNCSSMAMSDYQSWTKRTEWVSTFWQLKIRKYNLGGFWVFYTLIINNREFQIIILFVCLSVERFAGKTSELA